MSAAALPASLVARWRADSALRASIASLAMRIGGMALFFAQAVLCARLLGPAGYGEMAFALSVIELAAIVALGGFGVFAIREMARLEALGDMAGVASFTRVASASVAVAAMLAGGCLAIAGRWSLMPGAGPLWRLGLVLIPSLALLQLARGMVQARGFVARAQWPGEVLRPLLGCAALLALLIGMGETAPTLALQALAAAAAIAAIVGLWQVRRDGRGLVPRPLHPREAQDWWRGAAPYLGTALAQTLHLSLATLLLGLMAGALEVGLFQPIARIAPLLLIPAQAAAMQFAPRVAGLWERGEHAALQMAARNCARLAFGLTLLMALALIPAGPLILRAFGPAFMEGAPMLLLVAAAQLFAALLGPTGWILAMTGREPRQLAIYLAALAVQALLALWLIPQWGAWGATVALCGGIATLPVLQYWQVRRHIRVDCAIFAKGHA